MDSEDSVQKKLEEIGEEFTVNLLRSEVERYPKNFEALSELANLLTKSGRYKEGLEADQRLASLRPADPFVHYNLACSFSLLARFDEAMEELKKAVELGYEDKEFLLKDKDLVSLRAHPSFQKILELIERRATP